jgi:hypothetical protein
MGNGITFKTNEEAPRSGVYRLLHTDNPIRDIRLLKGKAFPACARFSSAIDFTLMSAIQIELAGARFRLLMDADQSEHYSARSTALMNLTGYPSARPVETQDVPRSRFLAFASHTQSSRGELIFEASKYPILDARIS